MEIGGFVIPDGTTTLAPSANVEVQSTVERGSEATIQHVLGMLSAGEERARRSFSFTPPENVLSPLARVPFVLDLNGRYYFDHMAKFGSWSFFGALEAGRVEQEVLLPMLSEATGADFVDVRPLSGLHCMTVAMSGLCEPGDAVVTIPVAAGGHMCTAGVAQRLGLRVSALPFRDPYELDLDSAAAILSELQPAAIYIDQSAQLFPIDPRPLREIVDHYSPQTVIHYDASHLNGLILTGAMFNPLEHGAHSLGGSTHKTLPGPHKGYLATNDPGLALQLADSASTFVSHHHPADVVSLAITLIELRDCGGEEYGRRVTENARLFAAALHNRGIAVAGAERGFTECHQVWASAPRDADPTAIADRLFESGIVVNKLEGLPGMDRAAFRFSLAEFTRMGADAEDTEVLADLVSRVILATSPHAQVSADLSELRRRLDRPRYCYDADQLEGLGAPAELVALCRTIADQMVCPDPGAD